MSPANPDPILIYKQQIATLLDVALTGEARQQAFTLLLEGDFGDPAFNEVRAEFIAALRNLIDDSDDAIRLRAIDTLGRAADPNLQQRLLEGIQHPLTALVPLPHAIQLLGYDIHGGFVETFKTIAEDVSRPEAARVQALRFLAADPGSVGLLHTLMLKQDELSPVRIAAAVSLAVLDRESFRQVAQTVIGNATEDEALKAVCETGSTLLAGAA